MCKVRSGSALRSSADVRSLITALIFRQQERYSKDSLLSAVRFHLEGAPDSIRNTENLRAMIDHNLDVMGRNNEVRCAYGYYYPTGILE